MKLYAALFLFFVTNSIAFAETQLEVNLPRSTYWRGETIHGTVNCFNSTANRIESAVLHINCEKLLTRTINIPAIKKNGRESVTFTLSTQYLRSNETYSLQIRLVSENSQQSLAQSKSSFYLVEQPNPDRLEVWQWLYGGPLDIVHPKTNTKAKDLGFTSAGGPVFPYSPPKADPEKQLQLFRSSMESAMKRGMDISICPVGMWYREYNLIPPAGSRPLIQPKSDKQEPHADPQDDTRYKGAGRNGHHYFNPFHPAVARQQNYANELMMRTLGHYPNLKYAFVDAEFVDDVYYHNANQHGLKQMQRMLGFTREEIGSPKYVAKGVIADDDRGLLYRRYAYQHGNGVNLALRRAAATVHQHRPDVKFISDPYRSVALLDMFPGCDYISTWTYTNPDPKLMLYIETLRAGL